VFVIFNGIYKKRNRRASNARHIMFGKVVFLAFLVSSLQQNDAARPNILMFFIDDLRWNDGSYKGSDIKTPTIDKFAHEGIRLQQYYVQRLCSPTRSALLAGRYPYHMKLARKVITNGHPFGMPLNQNYYNK